MFEIMKTKINAAENLLELYYLKGYCQACKDNQILSEKKHKIIQNLIQKKELVLIHE